MAAKAVIATNTTNSGMSTASIHASQAERPTAPRSTTSAGVKQQTAVTTVPATPSFRRFFLFTVGAPLLLALTGCGGSSKEYTRDESGAFVLYCDQSELRWNACYEKAARLCGENGYQIVSEPDGGAPTATTNIYEVPVIGDSMVIRCNQ
jgi:hypothetical protein